MRCNHCGLPTGGEQSHGTVEQCVAALLEETRRLREEIASLQRDQAPAPKPPKSPPPRRDRD